jgi:hypothetical protein
MTESKNNKKVEKNDLAEHEEMDDTDLDDVAGGCGDGGPLRRTPGGGDSHNRPGRSTLAGGGRAGDPTVASFEWSDELE